MSERALSRRAMLRACMGASLLTFACRRAPEDAPESLLRPLSAALGVAPIVDQDPWVIAFLTGISIARPPGVDARLEGRTGSEGLRHPEPIIEDETREALAEHLAAYEGERPRQPRLEPVWQADPFGPKARVRWRLYFVDRGEGFIVDHEARAHIEHGPRGPDVRVLLGQAQRTELAELSYALVGRRLAVTLEDELLMLPILSAPIEDGVIQLATNPHEDREQGAAALLERLTR